MGHFIQNTCYSPFINTFFTVSKCGNETIKLTLIKFLNLEKAMVFPLTSTIFLVLYCCQNSGFILVARTIGMSFLKNTEEQNQSNLKGRGKENQIAICLLWGSYASFLVPVLHKTHSTILTVPKKQTINSQKSLKFFGKKTFIIY